MVTLADRAAQTLAHLPIPALPLDDLVQRLRQAGSVVTPEVLLRAVESCPGRFRVLDPWRGPWRRAESRDVGSVWVLSRERRAFAPGVEGRLQSSLAQIGATVDESSVGDLARWLGMIREVAQLTGADLRRSA